MKRYKRSSAELKADRERKYDSMEKSVAGQEDFRRPAYAVRKAIVEQAEQITETPAEYIARKASASDCNIHDRLIDAARLLKGYCDRQPTYSNCSSCGCPFYNKADQCCNLGGFNPSDWEIISRNP